MGLGMGGHPGRDRSREKQLVHDNKYRPSGPASEQLQVGPPKNQPPEPEPSPPVRLLRWLSRRWNGE